MVSGKQPRALHSDPPLPPHAPAHCIGLTTYHNLTRVEGPMHCASADWGAIAMKMQGCLPLTHDWVGPPPLQACLLMAAEHGAKMAQSPSPSPSTQERRFSRFWYVRGWAKHTVCRRAVGGGGEPCEARITLLATHHRVVPHSGVYFLGGSGATWFQYGSVNIAIRGDRSCGTCRHISPCSAVQMVLWRKVSDRPALAQPPACCWRWQGVARRWGRGRARGRPCLSLA